MGGVRKCVKLSLIKGSNISYSNHKIGEEAIYSYQVLRHAKSVGFINEPVYCYMLHDDSLSNTKMDDPWGNVALALREEIMKQGDYPQYADTLNAFIKTAGAVAMMRTAQNHPFKLFREKGRVTLSNILEVADKSYSTDWKHASEKARLMYCLMELRLWPVIWIVSRLRG